MVILSSNMHVQSGIVKKLQFFSCAVAMCAVMGTATSGWAQDALQPMPAPLNGQQDGMRQEGSAGLNKAEVEVETKKEETATRLTPEERLDKLFAELLRTSNEAKARRIAAQISGIWAQSGSATVDLLLGWSFEAMKVK
jgi:hypothetical protein